MGTDRPPFDAGRARLGGPDYFERFSVPARGQPLADAGLGADEDLIVVERGGARRALLASQMGYHHVAQGKGDLHGEPYLVSF